MDPGTVRWQSFTAALKSRRPLTMVNLRSCLASKDSRAWRKQGRNIIGTYWNNPIAYMLVHACSWCSWEQLRLDMIETNSLVKCDENKRFKPCELPSPSSLSSLSWPSRVVSWPPLVVSAVSPKPPVSSGLVAPWRLSWQLGFESPLAHGNRSDILLPWSHLTWM